jgi:hypothetical protein
MGKLMNAWLKWIKYSICTLKKVKLYYSCVTGRPELQVVPFPLGWTSDSAKIKYIITLFQKRIAWGNESCMTLSLLFPMVKDSGGTKATLLD